MTAGNKWADWFPNLAPTGDDGTALFPLFSYPRRNRAKIHQAIIAAAAALLERLLLPYDISTVNADTTLCGNTHQLSHLNDSYTNALVAAPPLERVRLVYGGDGQHSGQVRRFLDRRLWLWILKAAQQAVTSRQVISYPFYPEGGGDPEFIKIYPPCVNLSITHNAYTGIGTGWKRYFEELDAASRHPTLAGYGFHQGLDPLHAEAMQMLYDIGMRGTRPEAVTNQNRFWSEMCSAQMGQNSWTGAWLVASGNGQTKSRTTQQEDFGMVPVTSRWNTELLQAVLCMLERMRTYYASGKFSVTIPHTVTSTTWSCTVAADGTVTMGSGTTTTSSENFAGVKYQRDLSVSGGGEEVVTAVRIEGDAGMNMFTSEFVRGEEQAGSQFSPYSIDSMSWEEAERLAQEINAASDRVAEAKTALDQATAEEQAASQAEIDAMQAAADAWDAWDSAEEPDDKAAAWAAYEAAVAAYEAAAEAHTAKYNAKVSAQNTYNTAKDARDEMAVSRDTRVEFYEVELDNETLTILDDAARNAMASPAHVTITLTRTLPNTESAMTLDGGKLWGSGSRWPLLGAYMDYRNAKVVVPEHLQLEWPSRVAQSQSETPIPGWEDPYPPGQNTWNKWRLHEFGDNQSEPKAQLAALLDFWRSSPEQFLYNSVGGLTIQAINNVKSASLGEVTGVGASGGFVADQGYDKQYRADSVRVMVVWEFGASANDWHNNGLQAGQVYPQSVYVFNRQTNQSEQVWTWNYTSGTWNRHVNETANYRGMTARAQVDDETLKFTVSFGNRAFSRFDPVFTSLVPASNH